MAVKVICDVFRDSYNFKKVMREIQILKEFSKMKENIFTSKLRETMLEGDSIILILDFWSMDLKKLMTD